MIIADIIKNLNVQTSRYSLTFLKDSNQKEIDLIIESGNAITPIEIKASEHIDSKFFDTLRWFQQETKNDQEPLVVYGGTNIQNRSYGKAIPWTQVYQIK